MKLQNAFVTEANAVGSYQMVGYEVPGSSTFDYAEPTVTWDANNTTMVEDLSTALLVWHAKAKIDLNKCAKETYWSLGVNKGSGSGVEFLGSIGTTESIDGTTFTADCLSLTSGFKTISDNN